MIRFALTVICDNDKCPDEASAPAHFTCALTGDESLHTLGGHIEGLPEQWITDAWFGVYRNFCSDRCFKAVIHAEQRRL